MVCVTAATGKLGRKVVDFLLTKLSANEIVAAVREPSKAEDLAQRGVKVRKADYDQPETMEEAFIGVQKLLLISSPTMGGRVEQHRKAIEAAKKASVEFLVYTSLLHADKSRLGLIAEEHRQTEQIVISSGLDFTILRNGWYVENYEPLIKAALAKGELVGSAGEGKISAAFRFEYAEVASKVLTEEGHSGKIYELAGDEAFTMAELAAEISNLTGKEIPYRNVLPEDYARWLVLCGFPEPLAQFLASIETGIAQGDLFDDSHQLSQLLGRPTTSWRKFVLEVLRQRQ